MRAPRLVIVGAGGHGAEIYTYVQDLVRHGLVQECLGFLDDAGKDSRFAPVLGEVSSFEQCPPEFFSDLRYLVAVGDNPIRRRLVERMTDVYGERLGPWTLVHPTCYLGREIEIGAGSCLAPGATLTCRIRIGAHCILNLNTSVSHDCVIGDFVNLNPGVTVCGNVTIGEGAYIGAGTTIKEQISIGTGAIIGAGPVVIDDVSPNVTAVGVPARVIKRHQVAV